MKAMIFAAGLGTRLKPLTDTLPKALVPIGGKTLLEWQIEKLKNAGFTDIIINVHHFPDQIIDFVHSHDDFGCNITISDEREMVLETGGGLRKVMNELPRIPSATEEPVLAMNVDILSNIDIPALIASYNPDELGVLVVSDRKTQRYLCFDDQQRLTGWTNIATGEVRGRIATPQQPVSDNRQPNLLAFSGMSLLSPRVHGYMNKVAQLKGDKFSLIDLYLYIVENKPASNPDSATLRAFIPANYRMMDVGKIDQLAEAEVFAESL